MRANPDHNKRSTDRRKVLNHFRDNWIQWLTFFMITWGVIGKPAKDIGIWAYKIGTLTEKFEIHCSKDSAFKIDIFRLMDANAQDHSDIKTAIESRVSK